MPVARRYPGVYIEEIPSGVRTITGVPTSVTAFIGRALRGPTDRNENSPVVIHSYGDFERIFGGLWIESSMSYAVRDFYLNGGRTAVVVRLYHVDPRDRNKAVLSRDGLVLEAAYPGAWGNRLRLRIDHDVRNPLPGQDGSKLFNLFVRDDATGQVEVFRNVSVEADSARAVGKVLANESALVRVSGALPANRPTAHPDPANGQDAWGDNAPVTNSTVQTGDQASDGLAIDEGDFTGPGKRAAKQGLYALERADIFNLLCIPPYVPAGDIDSTLVGAAASYCEERRAMLLVDPLSGWKTKDDVTGAAGVSAVGTSSRNAALFFPRLRQPNPQRGDREEDFVPCGAVAGLMALTDTRRGVWKAPAGLEATLVGVPELSVTLTDHQIGELNPLGVNCLRATPAGGRVVWGSRTLQGNDRLASEWKYIPVRRTALYIEESLYRGTQWVVFEPNDEPLWAQIRLNVGAFMHDLFRQGAFQGQKPSEAYFVKCDGETTTQADIDNGIVTILIGFAPLKPAEFVIVKIQQMAGQIAT